MEKRTIALLKVHSTAVLFGLSGVFGVLIESGTDVLVFGRAVFAFLFLWIFFKARGSRLTPRELGLQLLSGILLATHWVTFYLGVKIGGVAVGTLGFASFPAFVTLFEMLAFKEKLHLKEYLLLLAISVGLVMITPAFEFGNQTTQGLLWGIASAASYGVLAVLNRFNAGKLSGTEASLWQYLAVALVLFPVTAPQLPTVSLTDWVWIACVGLFCTTLAYTFFVSSLDTINARTAAMIISLESVYAIAVAWILLGEPPTLKMLIGGAIIILSVAWTNLKK
ncbi:EamA family transporter [Haemophilus paracuniculus]|uniref:EamA family transporter n=1 Tax=Haemophilus paracuniculus TaxID=734 RepID=A0A1T0AV71_9PAST|nr:DMT family transporter [Haemophilus paracuniculus]OOS00772.1 EamA family transporter [Haemophilus paracuniculus]